MCRPPPPRDPQHRPRLHLLQWTFECSTYLSDPVTHSELRPSHQGLDPFILIADSLSVAFVGMSSFLRGVGCSGVVTPVCCLSLSPGFP